MHSPRKTCRPSCTFSLLTSKLDLWIVTSAWCSRIRRRTVFLEEAYDPAYGARPLRRYLEKRVVTELSRMLLDGHFQDHTTVTIQAITEPPLPGESFIDKDRIGL